MSAHSCLHCVCTYAQLREHRVLAWCWRALKDLWISSCARAEIAIQHFFSLQLKVAYRSIAAWRRYTVVKSSERAGQSYRLAILVNHRKRLCVRRWHVWCMTRRVMAAKMFNAQRFRNTLLLRTAFIDFVEVCLAFSIFLRLVSGLWA